ncbi:MAG: type IVB secretion system protein IcmW [Gammaproteobacteria bacterium]|nr:type IVB secretion system protein IcmW [Gammaproteobacteria bacterium]
MPDLSYKAVHQFWNEYQDPLIYRVISFMEGVEDWTLDNDPQLETALSELGKTLDDLGSIDIEAQEDLIKLVAHIKTGRGLRLLMALDTAYPGAAAKVLMHAEEVTRAEDDIAGIFLRRNIVFERLRLIGRVFGRDRFKLILEALEDSGYD